MQLNLVLVCVAVCGVSHVLGGCVEDPFSIHGLKNDERKDVELIGKELKFKLDHGLHEKELMEKTLKAFREHLLGQYQATEKSLEGIHHTVKESKVDEKNDFLMKALHGMLGPDFKKEDISEEDLKAMLMFLKSLSTGKDGELFVKKDGGEFFKEVKPTEDVLKPHGHIADEGKISDEKFKDFETHLAESVLHMLKNKDAERYVFGDKDTLDVLKKFDGGKAPHVDEAVPYFLMPDGTKLNLKDIFESGKHAQDETRLKQEAEKESLKKLFLLMKDIMHKDAGIHTDKESHFKEDKHIDEGITKAIGSLKTERAVSDLKALAGRKARHHEGVITHEKDLIFDEILKKEEVHSLDEDDEIFHEYGKTFEDEKSKALSPEHSIKTSEEESAMKAVGLEKAKKEIKAEEEKSIKDILKEDGYYITRGTDAYEKAREQAHEDAKVSLTEEAKKKLAASGDHHFIKDEEGIKKEVRKGIDDKSFPHGEDTVKAWKDSGYFKVENKPIYDSGVGFGEEHIKHSKKADESHSIHGSSDEGHLFIGAEATDEDKSHGKAHGLKNKFLSTLSKILNLKKCHLVSMRPGELLGIVDCISRSKNPMLCEKFAMCEKKRPLQVILASEKCQMETISGEAKRCTTLEPLYPSRDIPLKIFKCVVKNTHELSPVEKKQMMEFEECARQVKVESCGRVPWG